MYSFLYFFGRTTLRNSHSLSTINREKYRWYKFKSIIGIQANRLVFVLIWFESTHGKMENRWNHWWDLLTLFSQLLQASFWLWAGAVLRLPRLGTKICLQQLAKIMSWIIYDLRLITCTIDHGDWKSDWDEWRMERSFWRLRW